ncbi:YpbS family protein [Paenibacillus hamazuiensis]|uniref:YpbS family protein n=1 Tax=Paenibacillus hamazuiensis TaxID=2936508 RepID=UPI00200D229F|nr:YpbS family protein [Paenibacillus hamazuiensis]
MDVREAITAHARKMHRHLEEFVRLDEERELAIDEAVSLCRAGKPFSVDEINRVTALINEHAKHGKSPTRPYVDPSMVEAYVSRLNNNESH